MERLHSYCSIIPIKATAVAESLGNIKVMNMVLLGALIGACNLHYIEWKDILKMNVNEKFYDLNCNAFDMGMSSFCSEVKNES